MHDLIIEDARIVDGTGGPSRHGSVAVQDGRIVEIGGAAGRDGQPTGARPGTVLRGGGA